MYIDTYTCINYTLPGGIAFVQRYIWVSTVIKTMEDKVIMNSYGNVIENLFYKTKDTEKN